VRLSFSPGPKEEIVVEAELDGQFAARVQGGTDDGRSRYVSSPHYLAKGKIESSLYSTATEEGVPAYIIAEMMQVFSFDVDFQRQIHPGDGFEAFYGDPLSGSSTKRNVLHYATLDLSGKTKTYYRFTTPDDGVTAYYDETGQSANKFLMRTPVSGARMTSSYGLRKHPLLGYTRMHSGVDFGLPQGSPIKAAGSGTVTQAGRSGGYGITVRLKHQKGYETLYAHMSRIASGIKPGAPGSTRARSSAMSAPPARRPDRTCTTRSGSRASPSTRWKSRPPAAASSAARCWRRSTPTSTLFGRDRRPDRARHAGAGEPAVAEGVLGQVLLMMGFGEIERPGLLDLGGDRAPGRGPSAPPGRRRASASPRRAGPRSSSRSPTGTACPYRCPGACLASGRGPPRTP
jgi:hypothetical protein